MNSIETSKQFDALTLSQAMLMAGRQLGDAGILENKKESRLLASHAFGLCAVELIANASDIVDPCQYEILQTYIARRLEREPVARIIGSTEFYGNTFLVSEATLDPRSDTETLVDVVLDEIRGHRTDALRILDIGTGSGVIVISLLHKLPHAIGVASDICPQALKTARINAQALSERVSFVETRWCQGINDKFDVIVSNPPYIKSGVIETLACEVKEHDPVIALDGGADGLDAYRCILNQCSGKLSDGGKLFLEIGFDQMDGVCALADENGWKFLRMERDIGGNERVLVFEAMVGR